MNTWNNCPLCGTQLLPYWNNNDILDCPASKISSTVTKIGTAGAAVCHYSVFTKDKLIESEKFLIEGNWVHRNRYGVTIGPSGLFAGRYTLTYVLTKQLVIPHVLHHRSIIRLIELLYKKIISPEKASTLTDEKIKQLLILA